MNPKLWAQAKRAHLLTMKRLKGLPKRKFRRQSLGCCSVSPRADDSGRLGLLRIVAASVHLRNASISAAIAALDACVSFAWASYFECFGARVC
jgi:hypothetical protein